MAKLFKTTFKLRRGSSEVWDKNNPILAYGEPGFDKDKYTFKIGDGKKHWKELKPIGATVQADWNQNDDTQPDYIKNRLAYTEGGFELGALIGEEVCMPGSMPTINIVDNDNLVEGKYYRFTINSIAFDMQCKVDYHENYQYGQVFYFGDVRLVRAVLVDQDMEYAESLLAQIEGPFYFGCRVTEHIDDETNFVNLIAYVDETLISSEYTFSVHELVGEPEIVHKIDPKYYERLAWADVEQSEILPATTITISDGVCFQERKLGLQKEQIYIVNWNGIEYKNKCILTEIEGSYILGLGNGSFIGLDDTGEPFGIAEVSGENGCIIMTNASDGDYTVSITELAESVHKIDHKFYDAIGWDYEKEVQLLPETTFISEDEITNLNMGFTPQFKECNVIFDGVQYILTPKLIQGIFFIGNFRFLGGFDTAEPFLIATPSLKLTAVFCEAKGEHTFSISQTQLKVHKVEKRYLPTPNYSELSPNSNNYIEGKPCYKGTLIADTNKLLQFDECHSENGYVRVADYIPYGNWANNIEIVLGGTSHPVWQDCYVVVADDAWEIEDIDIIYIMAIGDTSNSSLWSRPGIYVLGGATVTMPLIKQIDSELVTVDWNNINNIPFGRDKAHSITLPKPTEGASNNIYKYSIGENGEVEDQVASFHRVYLETFSYEDLIGSCLILNDGSIINITENSFKAVQINKNLEDQGYYTGVAYEIENLLICAYFGGTLETNFDDSFAYIRPEVGTYPSDGIYTSNSTGVYVKEIRWLGEVKKIPEELLPDGLLAGNSPITDEEVDALIALII